QIIFASDRAEGGPVQRTSMWTGAGFTELYQVPFQPNKGAPGTYRYGPAEKFSTNLNTKFNEAAATFSADGKTIFFTRNNLLEGKTGRDEEGLVKLKIYTGSATQPDQWGQLEALPFCSDNYSVAHPSLSADGQRLYFASNKPGGYGGMDLYFSELESGRWGLPINLGPDVNTEGNEIFPFIHADGRLYFASNGQTGLGGLDIYYTTPKGKGDWNIPVNPGAPLNSTHDDFGITFGADGTWGFFSSDRDGGLGRDDIYGFTKHAVPVEITVTDPYAKAPVAGVAIMNQTTGLTLSTSNEGKITFDMRADECVVFEAAKKNYETARQEGCSKNLANGETLKLELKLEKKANYTIQGLVFDMIDGLPAEGVLVTLTNDCGQAVDVQNSSEEGRYQFKLDKNCCYTVKATAEGYIADVSERNCTVGLPPNTSLRADLSMEPYRDQDGFVVKKAELAGSATPHFNAQNGLYENADGSPASFDFGNGLNLRSGVLFDNDKPTQPAKSDWERSAAGFLVHIYYDFNAAAIRSE
ncbi:MAG: carboxypeptidase regulatory-like domain-containing protein, partial [Saprospiraceae bacterium]